MRNFLEKIVVEQLTFNFNQTEGRLKELFERTAGRGIALTITDNSTSMISIRAKEETLSVRLHRIFLDAGADVIDEVAGFIKKRGGKTPLVSGFIRERRAGLRKKTGRRVNIITLGKHYDLLNIYESVNNSYFEGSISSTITWGAKSPRHAVRKRTLGSFSSHTNSIRINPLLDSKRVPPYFIEFIVYHEMLHAHMGVQQKNGRRSMHSKEFRKREKLFKKYEKAVEWEKRNRI